MKIVKRIIIKYWGKKSSNKAFFMPTVVVYLTFFLSFMIWQSIQVLTYKSIVLDYQEQIIHERAYIDIENKLKLMDALNTINPCIPQILINLPIFKKDYSIISNIYCLRNPGLFKPVLGTGTIKKIIKTISLFDKELGSIDINLLRTTVLMLMANQTKYGWVGVPRGLNNPLKAAEYAIVMLMDKYYVFDNIITTKNKTYTIFVFYNATNQEVEKIVYNK